jgi:hypothetical protein
MALVNVNLRIVGLYFNEIVRVDDAPTTTVRTVMDEYIRLHPEIAVPGGLEYGRFPINGRDFVTTLTYHFGGDFNFDANKVVQIPPDGPSLGDQSRPAGIYTLSESLEDQFSDTKVGLVWQYYVVSAAGEVKSKTPVSRGFSGFGEPLPNLIDPLGGPDIPQTFADGDSIIWRLVAIARRPNFLPDFLA